MLSLPPLSLYVHFPWCVAKCPYCDFNSYALRGSLPEQEYLARLKADLQEQAREVSDRAVISVFFGGGTPSLFPPRALAALLETVRTHLKLAPQAEVTLEANPGAVERGAFAEYRAAGITRVSLGAQSFDAARLRSLGRIHSPAETERAAAELHAAGLANFNLDLMYALPGQDGAAALADVAHALALAPAHISHYQLTLEPGTPFAAAPPPLPDDDEAAGMLGECAAALAAAGYAQYEVSAYARAGRQSVHNLNYWRFGDYLGIGAGAHGKLTFPDAGAIVRSTHLREPRRYLGAGAPQRHHVPDAERPFEFMLNALRLCEGFTLETFAARTGLPPARITAALEAAARRGLLQRVAGGWRPTPLGLRFLNEALLLFMEEKPQTAGLSTLSIGRHTTPRGQAAALFTGERGLVGE